jgi:hypothetical protein
LASGVHAWDSSRIVVSPSGSSSEASVHCPSLRARSAKQSIEAMKSSALLAKPAIDRRESVAAAKAPDAATITFGSPTKAQAPA